MAWRGSPLCGRGRVARGKESKSAAGQPVTGCPAALLFLDERLPSPSVKAMGRTGKPAPLSANTLTLPSVIPPGPGAGAGGGDRRGMCPFGDGDRGGMSGFRPDGADQDRPLGDGRAGALGHHPRRGTCRGDGGERGRSQLFFRQRGRCQKAATSLKRVLKGPFIR